MLHVLIGRVYLSINLFDETKFSFVKGTDMSVFQDHIAMMDPESDKRELQMAYVASDDFPKGFFLI